MSNKNALNLKKKQTTKTVVTVYSLMRVNVNIFYHKY